MSAPLHWPLEALWEALAPRLPGFTAELLASVDSTNSECMRRLRNAQAEPLLLVAEQQTAGRGRMGRAWQSPPSAAALTFSLALPLAPQSWSGLSLAVGLAVAQALQPQAPAAAPAPGSSAARVALKWPNDLWLQSGGAESKLGGILVETASLLHPAHPLHGDAHARWVVVGIGLNVNAHLLDHQAMTVPPAGLQQLDARWDAPKALAHIVVPLVDALQAFERQGFAPQMSAFAARDLLAGRNVRLSDGREGTATGVGPDGALRVRGGNGDVWNVSSAEISVRPLVTQVPAAGPRPGAL